jgi:hypothetical protein
MALACGQEKEKTKNYQKNETITFFQELGSLSGYRFADSRNAGYSSPFRMKYILTLLYGAGTCRKNQSILIFSAGLVFFAEILIAMKRKIEQKLAGWKSSPNRMPLIVNGARQIGKTSPQGCISNCRIFKKRLPFRCKKTFFICTRLNNRVFHIILRH